MSVAHWIDKCDKCNPSGKLMKGCQRFTEGFMADYYDGFAGRPFANVCPLTRGQYNDGREHGNERPKI
jgi:hypothetical protein